MSRFPAAKTEEEAAPAANEAEGKEEEADDCLGDLAALFPPPEYSELVYHFGGHTQRVLALPPQFAQIVIGEVVWRGATALCEWLVRPGGEAPFAVAGARVVEVGAGCGVCGVLCKQLGARQVLLTDYEPHVLELLARNAELNGLSAAEHVRALDWLQPLPPDLAGAFDAVIGSDVVYCRDLCPGLFATAAGLLVRGGCFAMVNGRGRFSKAADLALSEAEAAGLRLVSQTAMDDGWQVLSLYTKL